MLFAVEAINPCTQSIDYLFGFGFKEFGFPGFDVGNFVDPNGDGGCVVGSFEDPFVGYAGEGSCGRVGGGRGARQICRIMSLRHR